MVYMDAKSLTLDSIADSILLWADPKNEYRGYTEGWLFTNGSTAFSIALVYLAFVFVGTAVMKAGIPAMDLYPLKFIYNISQIMFCAYMTIEAFLLAYRNKYTLSCNVTNSQDPPFANLVWMFYASKIWDFWDTFFIVLGKKWKQLSFLHVYHHFTIFLYCWLTTHIHFDGDIYLSIILNGFIHTVMYTYYFICMHTKDPKTGKSLPIWWKSSLTMMQMIQFVVMMSQGTHLISTKCKYASPRVVVVGIGYVLSLLFLFGQFYIQAYTQPKEKKSA